MTLHSLKKPLFVAISAVLLSACGSDDDDDDPVVAAPETAQFQVSITNLTFAQPQSPAGVIFHEIGYSAFAEGQRASVELETMAEGGAAAPLLTAADADANVVATYEGPTPVAPGGNRTFSMTVTTDDLDELYLTALTMLVNTNDAFTGVNSVSLAGMAVGDSRRWTGPVWDAGTELNTEADGTMPGPADGGEGFNAARDDFNDVVVFHAGVLTQDEGKTDSVLTAVHKFDQPAVSVRVTRTQ